MKNAYYPCSSFIHKLFIFIFLAVSGLFFVSTIDAATITSGTVYVDIDARDLSLNNGDPVTAWVNNGGGGIPNFASGLPVAPTFSSNVGGVGAVTFDGVDDRMETFSTGAPSDILGNGTWSVETWVYTQSIALEESVFSWAARANGTNATAQLNYGSSPAFGALTHFGDGDMGYNGGAPAAGSWHYIAATYDGTTQRLYVNGALNATNTPALGLALTDPFDQFFIIGSAYNVATMSHEIFYNGSIGQVTVNGGVLSPTDILHNFNENAAYYSVPEPSATALLLGLLAFFAVFRRKA